MKIELLFLRKLNMLKKFDIYFHENLQNDNYKLGKIVKTDYKRFGTKFALQKPKYFLHFKEHETRNCRYCIMGLVYVERQSSNESAKSYSEKRRRAYIKGGK